jgi:hypothetical protein
MHGYGNTKPEDLPLPDAPPGAILEHGENFSRLLFSALAVAPVSAADAARIGLQGTWNIRLDPAGAGHNERWSERPFQGDPMFLPGSTDEGGYARRIARTKRR